MINAVRGALFAVISMVLVATACGCGSRRSTLPVLRVSERDFSIVAPPDVSAGELRLVVHNEGPVAHELLLARLDPGRLPVRSDGFTVDEESLESRIVAAVEPQVSGRDTAVEVTLQPGRYVLFCNMAGHFAAGMHRTLRVR
jgi:hypothetical protein